MGDLITRLPRGRLEAFDDQEVKHASDIADQPKYRFSIPQAMLGPGSLSMGGISGNTERPPTPENPDGELDERGFAGFRSLGDGRWAFVVGIQYAEGEDPREVLIVTSDGVYANEPFKGLLEGSAAPPPNDGTVAMSRNGRFWVVQQDDGNLVKYELAVPFDKRTGTAVWASDK